MQINIQPNGQETVVQIIGLLDTTTTNDQADELQRVLDIADKALVMDCSELEYIAVSITSLKSLKARRKKTA